MLLIEGHRQRHRQLAQLALGAVEGLAAEGHQPAQFAVLEGAVGELHQVAARIAVADHEAAGILGGAHRLELEAAGAADQTQAVAQGQVVAAAVLDRQPRVDALAQLGYQLVAHVEQAVGRLAGLGLGHGDLAVEVGDLAGGVVDLADLILELTADAGLHVAQVTLEGAELAGQRLRGAQHSLAGGRVGRRGHHILQGGEEVAHQRR
ncbi:hypothetical protein D3C75_679530 [compost metagenome]